MNKKKLGGIAALSLAAITAVPTFSIVASAVSLQISNIYRVEVLDSSGNVTDYQFYIDSSKANEAKENGVKTEADPDPITGDPIKHIPVVTPIAPSIFFADNPNYNYDAATGQITKASGGTYQWTGGTSGTTTPGTTTPGTISSNDKYTSAYCWYSSVTGRYYLTREDAITASGNASSVRYITSNGSAYFSSSYPWYSSYTGRYYRTYPEALAASDNNPSYVSGGTYYDTDDYSYSGSLTYRYYSSATGRYYKTWNDAYVASNYDTSKVSEWNSASSSSTYSSTYSWYSSYTGRYYQTYAAALAVSPNSSYVSQGSASSSSTYSSTYSWYSSYTRRYYQTYAAALAASNNNSSYVSQGNYYYYNNPYYYYYGLNGYYGLGGLGNTTTTNRDTSSVTIGNLKGWTSVIRTVNSAKSGASYTVNMKTETEIPSNVLTALKGKNVTINFKFSNGAVFSLNGADISSTSAISPVIRYGSTSIPSSLKKKAVKSNDGVSSSQFTINGNSFGADASVTVKFNSKRAGCSAKLYRYNASANTLSLVSRSAVQSNGQCKFDNVKQGGEYIVVLS